MKLNDHIRTERGRGVSLARALNVSSVTVHQWAVLDKQVPADRCPAIEFATSGEVTCEELRADIKWVRVRDRKWPNPNGRPLIDCFEKAA